MAEIKAEKIKIGDLFSERFRFRIPNFQRPLSWKKDDFDKLFEDIYSAFTNKQEEYFLGSIILQTQDAFHDIIDGQQRLVAIAILLAVIRDKANNDSTKREIQESLYGEEKRLKHLPAVVRIKMWEDLTSTEKFIFESGKTLEYKNKVERGEISYKGKEDPKYLLYQAINLYIQKYDEKLTSQADDFVDYLFNNVYVVYITTDSLPYAIQLFNVLNTRGRPLTTADILKAVNLGEIDEGKREDWAKRWRKVENDIGREEVEKVIEFIRTLKLKAKARASIYEEYEKLIFGELIKKGEKFIEYLQNTSEIYRNIVLEPDDLKVENKYKNLVKLMKEFIPFDDWIPPLIAFYEKFSSRNEKLIGELMWNFLDNLEKKVVTEWVRGLTPTERIESMNEVIKLIEEEDDPKTIIHKLTDWKSNAFREEFKNRIDSSDFYYENFAKYILLRIDLKMWEQENFPGYQGMITIEHILPQEPPEDSEWVRQFNEEVRREWTNKIGNLVLLSRRKNSRAKNYDFQKKKEAYFFKGGFTPFRITQELQNANKWTPEDLKGRHQKLIDKLIEIYFGASHG